MKKIICATTISLSLNTFCKGILSELKEMGYDVLAVSSPDDGLNELAEREGVRVEGVPMERHISPLKDLMSLCKLVKVFRREKPDMVHSMTPKAGLLCMMAGWMARVPVRVHTFTGLVWPTEKGLKRRILMTTDWLTCACATHVIPEGYGVLSDLREHITKMPMRVLGYGNVRGIDLQYWQVNSSYEGKRKKEKGTIDCSYEGKRKKEKGTIDCSYKGKGNKEKGEIKVSDALEHSFTFLFVGRIVGDKGINELVEAFNKLIERNKEKGKGKNCRLVLVGRYEEDLDPVSEETRRMIETMPEIEAVGAKYGDDLLQCYAESDCFVFPSYREGFPNTVIEAGAMELPCIVTDINGSREIIIAVKEKGKVKNEKMSVGSQHLAQGERMSVRENGVVIPAKDADALFDAMVWMMEHEEERAQMGKRAREIISERFEQGFVRQQLYQFYDEVLGEIPQKCVF